jgi:putative thiamine transport system substrate-binding protein
MVNKSMTRDLLNTLLGLIVTALVCAAPARAAPPDWDAVTSGARGQAVYWHAWGGDENVNRYIAWIAAQVKEHYGVDLRHVKVADISETVTLLVAEKTAGRADEGRVDLMWINGENFAALKKRNLLYGPFAESLPNFALVDTVNKPTTLMDFTTPTDGFESPWGMAQLVFFADSAQVADFPRSMAALLEWARAHPGRFTYPAPPDFTGSTFLKQALLELAAERSAVYRPAREIDVAQVTAPLWRFLDALHPSLWRKGAAFPVSYPALRQLLSDSEVDMAFAFNPAEASSAIAQKLFPQTVRPFVFDGGTIGNTHFVAIPASARAKEGAMVVANFLLSPEAQSRKANPDLWGDPTVLDTDTLSESGRAYFTALPAGKAMPTPADLRRVLPEPHPSWMTRIEQEWQKRYSR